MMEDDPLSRNARLDSYRASDDDDASIHFWIGMLAARLKEEDVPAPLREELNVMLNRMRSAASVRV
jgi:hypothetical protein